MSTAHLFAESRLALLILLALFIAPYTKVEESFNIQATHDILTHGVQAPYATWLSTHYDHVQFQGAVPRTFIGALALAGVAKPFSYFLDNESRQTLVRAILGLWNAFCIARFSRGVRRLFGDDAGTAFLALQACQFHVVYYSGRTLPNFFAFGFATLAQRDLLLGLLDNTAKPAETTRLLQRGLFTLTLLGIIFRSEIAALLAVYTIWTLYLRRLSLLQTVTTGFIGLVVGLSLTVSIDSFFWQKLVWPEFNAFIFNVIEGKSEEWGVSPFYHYFVVALPKLLFNPTTFLICIPVALLRDASSRTRTILGLSLAYVGVLSVQAHKEWRFIVYVLPPLTTVAAFGADQLWKARNKGQQILLAVVLASVPVSMIAGFAFLVISSLNYPGAAALNRLHIISNQRPAGSVSVHMDILTCMTGVTRFLEIPSQGHSGRPTWTDPNITWAYNKEEDPELLLTPQFWEGYDFVIAEGSEKIIGAWEPVPQIGEVTGFSGFLLTKSEQGLKRQTRNADLAGDSVGQLADLGRNLVVWWNKLGLALLSLTKEKWLTLRMEPKLQILRPTKG